jgi:adenosylhomocysteine nucleosidase
MGNLQPITCVLAIVAMQVEEQAVVQMLGPYSEWKVSPSLGIEAKVFEKNGRTLILARSGIGIANAAATTALIVDKRHVDGVILFGVAGGITKELDIGDLVIATSVIQHDSLFSGENGFELMAPGFPFVTAALAEIESPIAKMDQMFRDWLRLHLQNLGSIKYVEGGLVSGSEFVGSGARKNELAMLHPGSVAVEMEAAGMAVITAKAKLPFAVIKTIADRLNPDESVFNDFNLFVHRASENAAGIIKILWEDWTS